MSRRNSKRSPATGRLIATHGLSESSVYHCWEGMIQRCHNPNVTHYHRYGGRGVVVCPRWRESFAAFLSDVGERPSPGHTLDRIDRDGNYEPGNVRWATWKQQQRNRKSNRLLTYQGVTKCVSEWAEHIGISKAAIFNRLRRGWDLGRLMTAPQQRKRRRG